MKESLTISGKKEDIDLQGIPRFILDLQQIQPTLNIMICGNKWNGASSLVQAFSNETRKTNSLKELQRKRTTRLGYTSCKIWKCLLCPRPQCFFSAHSNLPFCRIQCNQCGAKPNRSHTEYRDGTSKVILVRHLSFVDIPGQNEAMQSMVSATSVSDGAILMVDSSQKCPEKEATQHIDAIHLLGLMKQQQLIVAQTKVELNSQERALASYEEIREFLAPFGDQRFSDSIPIIPISAQRKLNVDALCHCIIHSLPKYSSKLIHHNIPKELRSTSTARPESLRANIIRSFDVNRWRDIARANIDKIAGGVLASAILSGRVEVGQIIEIRPGRIFGKEIKRYNNRVLNRLQPQWTAQPIRTVVKTLRYGRIKAHRGFPAGTVAIQTNIDPSLTKRDGLCGHVIVDVNDPNPPPIFNQFKMSYHFLARAGHQKAFGCDKMHFEEVRLNIGTFRVGAEVVQSGLMKEHHIECERIYQAINQSQIPISLSVPSCIVKNIAEYGIGHYDGILCVLRAPICARVGDKVGIGRYNKRGDWVFAGAGIIRETKNILNDSDRQKKQSADNNVTLSSKSKDSSTKKFEEDVSQ